MAMTTGSKAKLWEWPTPELPPSANPTEWGELALWEIEAYRRLGCPHDSKCLAFAAARHWNGFSCVECPLENLAPEGVGQITLKSETIEEHRLKLPPKKELP
jgi:hypothetical protein